MPGSDAESSQRSSFQTVRNGSTPSTPHSISLTRAHITEALSKSPDNGATLDLTHMGLSDVGESGAEELATVGQSEDSDDMESTVVRIALAYNRLTTLPMAFSLLSRLRYLVLKNNNFAVFPDVLTVMPSLEILDVSRNKIKRLPSEPGSLVNLKVFSIHRNKIPRLPAYIAQFRHLTIFKAEHNPIDWPPKAMMEGGKPSDNPQGMVDWIRQLQSWLTENSPTGERKHSDDSVYSDTGNDSGFTEGGDSTFDDRTPLRSQSPNHLRSLSVESDSSTFFQIGGPRSRGSPGHSPNGPPSPLRLHLDPFFSQLGRSSQSSPTRSNTGMSPTEDSAPVNIVQPMHPQTRHPHHLNGLSGISTSKLQSKAIPPSKKSMPELRPTRLQLGHAVQRAAATALAEQQQLASNRGLLNGILDSQVTASPLSIVDRPVPPMDTERNSYFRRLSTIGANHVSKVIPEPLLVTVDAVRGILFALSQIYQTLQHYTVYAIDERLSAILQKVLGPASQYMTQLINALDRFDTTSRRGLPSPATCRAVVESCRDNVTVFGKGIGMLSLQLKVLAKHDDVRYTRHLLLVLYGSMAEIAAAWQKLYSHIEAVRPLLWDPRPPRVTKSHTVNSSRHNMSAPTSAPLASSSVFASAQQTTPARAHLRTNTSSQRSLDLGKVQVTRRHAGSFSAKDVEMGKMLPSNDLPPFVSPVPSIPQTPIPRTMRRLALQPTQDMTPTTHSRQNSELTMMSTSPLIGGRMESVSTASSTLVDKEVLGAIKVAVVAAPEIWVLVDAMLEGATETKDELRDMVERAREVTERLRQSIQVAQEGTQPVDGRALHDDAHIFAKIVIHLSNALKTRGTTHPISSTLKMTMRKLVNATQEFVILLHVSSFSPAPTPGLRSYTPMATLAPYPSPSPYATSSSPLSMPEDGKLGANIPAISRARGANPSPGAKLL